MDIETVDNKTKMIYIGVFIIIFIIIIIVLYYFLFSGTNTDKQVETSNYVIKETSIKNTDTKKALVKNEFGTWILDNINNINQCDKHPPDPSLLIKNVDVGGIMTTKYVFKNNCNECGFSFSNTGEKICNSCEFECSWKKLI